MKHKQFTIKKTSGLISAIVASLIPTFALAQAYGQAPYGTVDYSNGVISIGGINLPNTGTTWIGIIATTLAAALFAIFLYRRIRHHRQGA